MKKILVANKVMMVLLVLVDHAFEMVEKQINIAAIMVSEEREIQTKKISWKKKNN